MGKTRANHFLCHRLIEMVEIGMQGSAYFFLSGIGNDVEQTLVKEWFTPVI